MYSNNLLHRCFYWSADLVGLMLFYSPATNTVPCYRAMLCRLSHAGIVSKRAKRKLFSHSGNHVILVFAHQML